MEQLLYNLINWQYFGILLLIWIVVDIVYINRWTRLFERIGKLIAKPIIFTKDSNPNDPLYYPRLFLEQLAQRNWSGNSSGSGTTGSLTLQRVGVYHAQLTDQVLDPKHPLRTLAHVGALLFCVLFVVADVIVVASTLALLGVIAPPTGILSMVGLSLIAGVAMAIIVALWYRHEVKGTEGTLISTENLNDGQRRQIERICWILIVISFAAALAFAWSRLIAMGVLQSSPTSQIILSFVEYGLLAFNNTLAAGLTFLEAVAGAGVLLVLLVALLVAIVPLLAFFGDLFWRAGYIVVDVVLWALSTPIVAVGVGLKKLVDLF